MKIGSMNHPAHDAVAEIERLAALGMEFIDLTLEPPCAASWLVDPRAIRSALERRGLEVVGHTAFYLPFASAIEEVRPGAVRELRRCIDIFRQVGARWMNLHPDRYTPFHSRSFFIARNLQSIRELLPDAERAGIGLMIENLPGDFNN